MIAWRAKRTLCTPQSCLRFSRGLRAANTDLANKRWASSEAAVEGGRDEPLRLLFDTKVSPSGTGDALFEECLLAIRRAKPDNHFKDDTKAITQLKQDELELTRKIFRRVDPTREMTLDHEEEKHHIDPYWSPFKKVRDLREQVTAEFDDYAKYASIAEQKHTRVQIKKSLRKMPNAYNPYTPAFTKYHNKAAAAEEQPKPFRLHDRHWEPPPLQARLARERITWRDIDIIQHFVADNGYILPRRTTMLPLKKQKQLVKAVKIAQKMSLLPYNWRPADYQAMPLMDPYQWMVDRLTDRVLEARDMRSSAMLKVMMSKHPELNYKRYLRHEASSPPKRHADDQAAEHDETTSNATTASTSSS